MFFVSTKKCIAYFLVTIVILPYSLAAKSLVLPYISQPNNEISRAFGRLMVGNAAKISDANDPSATWLPDKESGAWWIAINSTLASMPDSKNRLIALSGTTATHLGKSVAIGVSGAAINDVDGRSAWGLYSDVQHESNGWSAGVEYAIKNKSRMDWDHSPYNLGNGVYGAWFAGGGDGKGYGGKSTHPSTAAIVILKNDNTWNRGIVFGSDALTGTTGDDTGTAVAISMAMGQLIQWENEKKQAATLGIAKGSEDGSVDIIATPAGASGKLKTPRLNISDIPTSPEGLVSGDIWRQGDTLKIVP